MTPERLLAHYDRIADAPDAVARLRALVIQLAVRGKLVPPSPSDEPVSLLLKRLQRERARRVAKGTFREPKSIAPIERESLPFTAPARWEWARLIDMASPSYGFAFASARFNSDKRGLPLIRIRDISNSDTQAYFDGDYDPAYIVKAGDYLVGMDGDFNLRRWEGRNALLNQRVMRINDWRCGICPEFARIPLQLILDFLHSRTSQTTVKHLSAKQINGIELPLPPVAEQHRIVAKVDELMAQCDQLEAARKKREATRDQLTTATLARLNASGPATLAAYSHVALHALPALTTRRDQIQQVRQTILNLAVRGKLLPQSPHDEPVSQLLKRVGELPRPARYEKRSPELIPGDCGLSINHPRTSLPAGWQWVPLTRIARLESGHTPSRNRPEWWGGNVPWMGLVDARAHNHGVIHETIQTTNEQGLTNSAARLLPAGTVCFSRTASVGYVVVMGRPMATSQDFVNWVPSEAVTSRWLQLVLIAERPAIRRFSKGAVHQTIYFPAWLSMHIALPPLAEQRRIVAKVDELIAFCDQLEAMLAKGDEVRRSLLEALLHETLRAEPSEAA
jgi:type I restriction enzyme S subunit